MSISEDQGGKEEGVGDPLIEMNFPQAAGSLVDPSSVECGVNVAEIEDELKCAHLFMSLFCLSRKEVGTIKFTSSRVVSWDTL